MDILTTRTPDQFVLPPGAAALRNHERDYDALAERLARRGQRAETVVDAVGRFAVAVPSWALGTGGTRFGRFPAPASRARSQRSWRTWRSSTGSLAPRR